MNNRKVTGYIIPYPISTHFLLIYYYFAIFFLSSDILAFPSNVTFSGGRQSNFLMIKDLRTMYIVLSIQWE